MTLFFMFPRPALALVLAPLASSIYLLASRTSCDAGQFAGILSSRHVSPEELWKLCSSLYSEGICISAGRMLRAAHHRKESGSYQQWARSACDAVEAASSQQRALLLRQSRATPSHEDAESRRLADIRNSASVHKLSLDVGRRYRGLSSKTVAGNRESWQHKSSSSVDATLQHKSIPIPHGTFKWESENEPNSSAAMDKAVEGWSIEHAKAVNESSPEVERRVNAFKGSTTPASNSSKLHSEVHPPKPVAPAGQSPMAAASVAPTVPASEVPAVPAASQAQHEALAESAAPKVLTTQSAPTVPSAAAGVDQARPGALAAVVGEATLVALSHLQQPPVATRSAASKLESPTFSQKAIAHGSAELDQIVDEVMGRRQLKA